MAIFLVRHAKAESRSAWTDGDTTRPLTEEGHAQARMIAASWAFQAPVAVWSSPRLRCVQTVEPLAARFGLTVGIEPLLEEDTPFERILPVLEAAPESTVWSSHGDVIPDVMNALLRRGLLLTGSAGALKKGAMFVLHRENDAFVRAEYVDSPRP